MLFSNDNKLFKEYFNLSDSNVTSLKDGLILGNSFIDEYVPYKDYKPYEYYVSNEREYDLLKIMELSFGINDLNLKLDLEPNNDELYSLFKKYTNELDNLKREYERKYNSLEVCDDNYDHYMWYKAWPWEDYDV